MTRLHIPNPREVKDWILSLTLRPTYRSGRKISRKAAPFIILMSVLLLSSAIGAKFFYAPKLVRMGFFNTYIISEDILEASNWKVKISE